MRNLDIQDNSYPSNFIKRKLYIIFSLISGLAIIWSMAYNFTDLCQSAKSAIDNETNLKEHFKKFSWFFYFSNIGNILFFIVTTVRIFYRKGIFGDQLQIMVCTYMLIVGCVYWLAIFGISYWDAIGPKVPKPSNPLINPFATAFDAKLFFLLYFFNDMTLHFINIIFATVLLFIGVRKIKYNFKNNIFKVLIIPVTYYLIAWLVYCITYYQSGDGVYIYIFWHFFHPLKIVTSNIAIIILLNIAIFIFVLSFVVLVYYFVIKMKNRIYEKNIQKDSKGFSYFN